ncbi:MAG: hypothetical protein U0350_05125 [Caldilineaceae bacterium]
MAYGVGAFLAFTVSWSATRLGFDKERSFYPTLMIVIASYYVLFAVMGGSIQGLLLEAMIMTGFISLSILGFRHSLWFVVAALLAHSVFDFFHESILANLGAPHWWPEFCLAYDSIAGIYLAWLISQAR